MTVMHWGVRVRVSVSVRGGGVLATFLTFLEIIIWIAQEWTLQYLVECMVISGISENFLVECIQQVRHIHRYRYPVLLVMHTAEVLTMWL